VSGSAWPPGEADPQPRPGEPPDPGSVTTPAITAARELGLDHEVRAIARPRSVEEAAERYGVPVQRLLKTLVVRRGDNDYLFVLVPGTRQLDWPKLRAHLGVTRLSLPDAEVAREVTGYERGTITPLGARHRWPVIADATIPGGGPVTIGAGRHGVSLRLDAEALLAALDAEVVDVTR
jgi:Cys-tRNA(Pro)/Cys-tRNA(Cys) deacylase